MLTPAPTDLLGTWALAREVADLRSGQTGEVTGILTLAAAGDDVSWVETGTLRWGSLSTPVHRRYLLRRLETEWWMLFDDGRRFHPWRPGAWVEHLCSADLYRGRVVVDRPGRWQMVWHVDGPHKTQRITTRLTST